MRVLGIDPGSETLGWGVVEGGGPSYSLAGFGTVKTSARSPFAERLARLYSGLVDVVEKFEPDVMAVEEAFYAVNVKVALKLGHVRGVVLLLAAQRDIEVVEYAPRLIKQTVVGYGNAEKHQVGEMVRMLLKQKERPSPHDAADALAVAICHFHHLRPKARAGR